MIKNTDNNSPFKNPACGLIKPTLFHQAQTKILRVTFTKSKNVVQPCLLNYYQLPHQLS